MKVQKICDVLYHQVDLQQELWGCGGVGGGLNVKVPTGASSKREQEQLTWIRAR